MSEPSPDRASRAALGIIRALRDAGHTAYLAGGCVRDLLIGSAAKDYDIATDATPDRVQALFPKTQEVGASFGVVLVKHDGVAIEVATFRSDGPYSDSRRPDTVVFSTPEMDAQRRDFTINALFLDPLDTRDPAGNPNGNEPVSAEPRHPGAAERYTEQGLVIDFVGGLEDIQRKVIRAVGDPDKRLAEDHLRALRAVRFASRYGFELDEQTAEAIRRHASELRGVSRERIGDELRRMLGHPSRHLAAWTLQYLGLDEPVLLEPSRKAAPKRLGRIGDESCYWTRLAAWAIDRGSIIEATQIAPLVARYREALNLSNEERDGLKAVLDGVAHLLRGWPGMTTAAQKRAAASDWFLEALRIVASENPEEGARIRTRVEQLQRTPSGLAPEPLVDGRTLIEAGFAPGPVFKRVLDAVYDAQLEDRVATLPEAIELARLLAVEVGEDEDESGPA